MPLSGGVEGVTRPALESRELSIADAARVLDDLKAIEMSDGKAGLSPAELAEAQQYLAALGIKENVTSKTIYEFERDLRAGIQEEEKKTQRQPPECPGSNADRRCVFPQSTVTIYIEDGAYAMVNTGTPDENAFETPPSSGAPGTSIFESENEKNTEASASDEADLKSIREYCSDGPNAQPQKQMNLPKF